MLFVNHDLMSHEGKKISCSKSRRSSSDNRYLLSCGDIFRRIGNRVRRSLIHGIFLKSPDIYGIIYYPAPAFFLTRMLADHGAGSREGVSFTYHLYSACIVAFLYERHITRHIHMGGTESDAWYRLVDIFHAASFLYMAFILIGKIFHAVQYEIGSHHTDSAVSAFCYHTAHRFHFLKRLLCCTAAQDAAQKPFDLHQTVSAGYAFAAGLIHGYLQQRTVESQRAYSRRV